MNLLEELDLFLEEDQLVDESPVLGGLDAWLEFTACGHGLGRHESALRVKKLHLVHGERQLALVYLEHVWAVSVVLVVVGVTLELSLVYLVDACQLAIMAILLSRNGSDSAVWIRARLENAVLGLSAAEEVTGRVSTATFDLESVRLHSILSGGGISARDTAMLLRGPVDLLLDLCQLGEVLGLEVRVVGFGAEEYVVLGRIAADATGTQDALKLELLVDLVELLRGQRDASRSRDVLVLVVAVLLLALGARLDEEGGSTTPGSSRIPLALERQDLLQE